MARGGYNKLHTKKARFLAAYGMVANISVAARSAGCSRESHYRWLRDDAKYPEKFKAAEEEAAGRLEAEAVRRAMQGSDTLLKFLLEGVLPEKYAQRFRMKHEGELKHSINWEPLYEDGQNGEGEVYDAIEGEILAVESDGNHKE